MDLRIVVALGPTTTISKEEAAKHLGANFWPDEFLIVTWETKDSDKAKERVRALTERAVGMYPGAELCVGVDGDWDYKPGSVQDLAGFRKGNCARVSSLAFKQTPIESLVSILRLNCDGPPH